MRKTKKISPTPKFLRKSVERVSPEKLPKIDPVTKVMKGLGYGVGKESDN